jgi:hypothetical protein
VQTTRYLSGRHTWESSGISTQREVPVVDPDIIRRLDVGQAAYLYRGGVTYLHVKPPAQPAAEEPLIRVRATPALPWAPPRPALPASRAGDRRPELADTRPLPTIQPAIESPPPAPPSPAIPKPSPAGEAEIFVLAFGKPLAKPPGK